MEPLLVIRASAGTGKTFALSSRYITLLLQGESPERILATTFTKKAAGEIAVRIFERLIKAARDPESVAILADELQFPQLTERQVRDALERLIASQGRLLISTLDSFFFRIARTFAFELGVPPQAQVLSEVATKTFFAEALAHALHGSQALQQVVRVVIKTRSPLQVVSTLQGMLQGELSYAERSFYLPPEEVPVVEAEWQALAERVQQLVVPKTKAGAENQHWSNAKKNLLALVAQGDSRELIQLGLVQKVVTGEEQFSRVTIDASTAEIVAAVVEIARRDWLRQYQQEVRARASALQALRAEVLVQRARGNGWTFEAFTEVTQRQVKGTGLAEIFYRLDQQIHHLMLDEFQDVSRAQWEVLEPLFAEIAAKASAEHTALVVGDKKQSIYRWRGGDERIFDEIEQGYPQVVVQDLATSYRCAPAVIEVVNQVFEGLRTCAEVPSPVAAWAAQFTKHVSARKDPHGEVSVVPMIEIKEDKFDWQEPLIQRVQALLQRGCRNIGILVRSNKKLALIGAALQRVGIAASEEGKVPLASLPRVQLLLAVLQTFIDASVPARKFQLVNLFPSTQEFTAESRDRAKQVFHREGLLGLWSYLRKQFGLLPSKEDPIIEAAISQLETDEYLFDVHLLMNALMELMVTDPSEAPVRVMTLHASKGLEFDAVILPSFDEKLLDSIDGVFLAEDGQAVLAVPQTLSAVEETLATAIEQEQIAKAHEALALLYVGLTRAKYSLTVFARGARTPEKKESISKFVELLDLLLPENFYGEQVDFPATAGTPAVRQVAPVKQPHLAVGERKRLLPIVSPSDTEDVVQLLAEPLVVADAQARTSFGTLMHKVLAKISWIEDVEALEHLVHEVVMQQGDVTSVAEAERVSQKIVRMIAGIAEIRKPQESGWVVFTERSCASLVPQGHEQALCVGIIDRLHWHPQKRMVRIFDFKTDKGISSYQALTEKYAIQLARYAAAAQQMFGERAQVEAQVVWVREG